MAAAKLRRRRRRTWWWYRSRPARFAALAGWDQWCRGYRLRPQQWAYCEYGYQVGLEALRRQWRDIRRGWWEGGGHGKVYNRVADAVRRRQEQELQAPQ